MKVFIILSIYLITAYGAFTQEQINGIMDILYTFMNECAPETGATDEDIKDLINMRLTRREGKCLAACCNKKYGIQDGDGKINKIKSLEVLKPMQEMDQNMYEKFYKIFDICAGAELKVDDECDIAYEFIECYREHKIKFGMRDDVIPM